MRLLNDGLDPDQDLLFNFKEHLERGVTMENFDLPLFFTFFVPPRVGL